MEPQSSLRLDIIQGSSIEPDPRLTKFYQYWRDACRGKQTPSRADIDPVDIPSELLPNLFLVEAVDGGRRFKFRLVGSESTVAAGRSLTGFHVDEVNPNAAYAEYVSNLYRRVMNRHRPVISVSHFGSPLQEHRITQRIMCPLSNDGRQVNMIVSCQVFDLPPQNWRRVSLTSGNDFQGIFEAVVL